MEKANKIQLFLVSIITIIFLVLMSKALVLAIATMSVLTIGLIVILLLAISFILFTIRSEFKLN